MFEALHCMAQENLNSKKIGEVFEELQNVVLEENGDDKMVRESS